MASLIIAAAGLSAVLIINSSAKQSYSAEQQFLIPNVTFTITSSVTNQKLTKLDYAQLRRQGFSQLVAVAQTRQHIFFNQTRLTQRRIDFTGIDSFSLFSQPAFSEPRSLSQGTTKKQQLDNPNTSTENNSTTSTEPLIRQLGFGEPSALLHPQLLDSLLGAKKEMLLTEDTDSELKSKNPSVFLTKNNVMLPKLIPLEEAALGNDIIMEIGQLYRLFPELDLSMLLVVGNVSNERQSALQNALPSHLNLNKAATSDQDLKLTSSFHLNLMAMALLMFVVCLFIVVNAVNLLLNGRVAWLKICRQLGISRPQLFLVQLIEIVVLTLIASFIGILLGIELAKIASPTVQATLESLYQVEVGFGKVSITGLFIQVFGICLLGSVCAIFIPLNKLNYQLANIKDLPFSLAQQRLWTRIIWFSFVLFATVGFYLLHNVQPLWLLLIATACIILSGCSLLLACYPSVLAIVQRVIPMRYPLLQVSSKQSLVLSGKTKIACCAFFIAATSNIGMNLMVDSFRGATLGWLDQRLAADYYVYHNGEPKISDLAIGTGVSVYQRLENVIQFEGKKIQQFSYPINDTYQAAMSFYDKGKNTEKGEKGQINSNEHLWKQFAGGIGVLVNQQFAFGFNYAVSDNIVLPHPTTGAMSDYHILGIIYDFGNPYAQVLMPLEMFDLEKSSSFLYAVQGNDIAINALRENMLQAGLDPNTQLLKTEDLLAISMQAFDNTFIITDGLNIVTLLVAALSLAIAIIVLMKDMRPQNMLIRSMGVSALKTQMLALFQYLLLCLVALLFATPFGILLSWILIFDINYQAFSWTYPLVISPMKIIQIYATSMLVVTVVIAFPIVQAGRKHLIEEIRWVN